MEDKIITITQAEYEEMIEDRVMIRHIKALAMSDQTFISAEEIRGILGIEKIVPEKD